MALCESLYNVTRLVIVYFLNPDKRPYHMPGAEIMYFFNYNFEFWDGYSVQIVKVSSNVGANCDMKLYLS